MQEHPVDCFDFVLNPKKHIKIRRNKLSDADKMLDDFYLGNEVYERSDCKKNATDSEAQQEIN
ncbi:MAG: hypothetical protein WC356_03765 [Candidatus Micrarchaeia archaeon]|jgi:hypothetical protein